MEYQRPGGGSEEQTPPREYPNPSARRISKCVPAFGTDITNSGCSEKCRSVKGARTIPSSRSRQFISSAALASVSHSNMTTRSTRASDLTRLKATNGHRVISSVVTKRRLRFSSGPSASIKALVAVAGSIRMVRAPWAIADLAIRTNSSGVAANLNSRGAGSELPSLTTSCCSEATKVYLSLEGSSACATRRLPGR